MRSNTSMQVSETLSRRDCLTSAAAATLGYTLAAGPVRAAAIKTGTDGLSAGMAKAKLAGGEMPVYYAKPMDTAKPPVILVAMEVFGLHEHIKDVARRLGKLGAFAIAPDYYFRLGDLTQIAQPAQLMPLVNGKPDDELFADLDATVDWAKSQGGDTDRLGIIGFCRGGRTVWLYATHNPNLKAGVASGRGNEGKTQSSGKNGEVQDLSRRGPWFLRRLPAKLSCGRSTRRLAVNAGLVQEIQGVGLIFGLGSETVKGCNRRLFHLKTPFQAIPKELAKDVQIRFS
jgi:dienelactone hydrolase